MTETARIAKLAAQLVESAAAGRLTIAAAESCTGGMVAAAITDVPGASSVFDRGFVTYSNEAKSEMLGVRSETLARFGAVSAEVAVEMAEGALRHSNADIAVAVTGVAGPTGGSAEKPVGLVWFGLAKTASTAEVERRIFAGVGRELVRKRATEAALMLLAGAVGR